MDLNTSIIPGPVCDQTTSEANKPIHYYLIEIENFYRIKIPAMQCALSMSDLERMQKQNKSLSAASVFC